MTELLERCSETTRRHRFGGAVRQWPQTFLRDCLAGAPERHDALVVATGVGSVERILGLGSAATLASQPDGGVVELSLLVEDAWQRAGLGRWLLEALLRRAWHRGVRRVVFQVEDDQRWVAGWAARHVTVLSSQADRGVLRVEAGLDGPGWADRPAGARTAADPRALRRGSARAPGRGR